MAVAMTEQPAGVYQARDSQGIHLVPNSFIISPDLEKIERERANSYLI